jgi:hypothetical protein
MNAMKGWYGPPDRLTTKEFLDCGKGNGAKILNQLDSFRVVEESIPDAA